MSLSAEEQRLLRAMRDDTEDSKRKQDALWELLWSPHVVRAQREVTINGKRFVVLRDEHGEYYEALGDVPAPRDEGQAQP